MVLWLSDRRVMGFKLIFGPKSSPIKDHSQRASFAACVAATYSALVVDNATMSCHFALQEMASPSIRKAYPEMACLSLFDIPSASEYQ
jgi:hypothetical protein